MYKSIRSDNLSSVLWTKKCGIQSLKGDNHQVSVQWQGDYHYTTAWARWSVTLYLQADSGYTLQVTTLEILHTLQHFNFFHNLLL